MNFLAGGTLPLHQSKILFMQSPMSEVPSVFPSHFSSHFLSHFRFLSQTPHRRGQKKQTSNFDHAQFLRQLRQKFIQYLILKFLSIVKRDATGQRMLVFLHSKTALLKWANQYIKPALFEQKFSALYLPINQISYLDAQIEIHTVPYFMLQSIVK